MQDVKKFIIVGLIAKRNIGLLIKLIVQGPSKIVILKLIKKQLKQQAQQNQNHKTHIMVLMNLVN